MTDDKAKAAEARANALEDRTAPPKEDRTRNGYVERDEETDEK